MELKVDELLSDIDDDRVTITAIDFTSVKRIKELTFARIHATDLRPNIHRRRSLSIGILVAIVVTFLVATVMAAMPDTEGYTMNTVTAVYLVSDDGQIIPYVKPNWVAEFSGSNVSATGIVINCTLSGGDYSGQLMLENEYYMERKTASGWEIVSTIADDYEWQSGGIKIAENETYSWTLDWSDVYGQLPAGEYRLITFITESQGSDIVGTVKYTIDFLVA